MKPQHILNWVLYGGLAIALILITVRGQWVEESDAIKAMEAHGYTDVRVFTHHWFLPGLRGCSGHDAAKFDVRGTNMKGDRVHMLVCSGWPFKGSTLRVP